MSKSRYCALCLVCAGTVAAITAVAPVAAADSGVLPQPGSEDASATISDLKSQGYNVAINWVNGNPDVDLSQCWVNGINTADAKDALPTAYVDVECPK